MYPFQIKCTSHWCAVIAGLGLIGGKEGFNQERIGDRVYRLKHNDSQNRCDTFAYSGAVGGAALSCLRGERGQPFLFTAQSYGQSLLMYAWYIRRQYACLQAGQAVKLAPSGQRLFYCQKGLDAVPFWIEQISHQAQARRAFNLLQLWATFICYWVRIALPGSQES